MTTTTLSQCIAVLVISGNHQRCLRNQESLRVASISSVVHAQQRRVSDFASEERSPAFTAGHPLCRQKRKAREADTNHVVVAASKNTCAWASRTRSISTALGRTRRWLSWFDSEWGLSWPHSLTGRHPRSYGEPHCSQHARADFATEGRGNQR